MLDAIGDHLFAVEKIRLRVACKAIFCEYFQDDGQESQAQTKNRTAIEKFADWANDMREEHCRELEEEARRVAELRAKAQEAREQYAEQQLERAKNGTLSIGGRNQMLGTNQWQRNSEWARGLSEMPWICTMKIWSLSWIYMVLMIWTLTLSEWEKNKKRSNR